MSNRPSLIRATIPCNSFFRFLMRLGPVERSRTLWRSRPAAMKQQRSWDCFIRASHAGVRSRISSSNSRSLRCKEWEVSCTFWAMPLGVRECMYWSSFGFCEKLSNLTWPFSQGTQAVVNLPKAHHNPISKLALVPGGVLLREPKKS